MTASRVSTRIGRMFPPTAALLPSRWRHRVASDARPYCVRFRLHRRLVSAVGICEREDRERHLAADDLDSRQSQPPIPRTALPDPLVATPTKSASSARAPDEEVATAPGARTS